MQNFYKKPEVFKRDKIFSDDNNESPIRDLVNEKGPMGSVNRTKQNMDLSRTIDNTKAKITERYPTAEINLGNEKLTDKAQ